MSARHDRAAARTSRWQPMRQVDTASSERAGWAREEPVEDGQAHRCSCGSLLARLVPGGIELKCRRCKRIAVLAFAK